MSRETPRDCEICRGLPKHVEVHGDWSSASGEMPAERERLEVVAGHDPFAGEKLLRCPLCDTFYRDSFEHEAPHWERSLRRIPSAEAERLLVRIQRQFRRGG